MSDSQDDDTHVCDYCSNPIDPKKEAPVFGKPGLYHENCYCDANAVEHCNKCGQGLVSGRNLCRTTDQNDTEIYLCNECWRVENPEKAAEQREKFDAELNSRV